MPETLPLSSLIQCLEEYYPPALAAAWDKIGLVSGAVDQPIYKVLICVDVTDAVVEEAIAIRADLLIAHHPLLFHGVYSIAETHFSGRILSALIRANIALYTAHTNADSAIGGVADILADKLGVQRTRPIEVKDIRPALDQWHVYIPSVAVEQVKQALLATGAGKIAQYDYCAWEIAGMGQYRALEDAHPYYGQIGTVHHEPETKLEFLAEARLREILLETIQREHPYEVPSWGFAPWINPVLPLTGIGRFGFLDTPVTIWEFAQRVQSVLPPTQGGIRVAGNPEALVETVALCPGAGDSLLDQVRTLGADIYVTADLRHHPIDEYHKAGGKTVIDAGHWATEFPWCLDLADRLSNDLPQLEVQVCHRPTEPWTVILENR